MAEWERDGECCKILQKQILLSLCHLTMTDKVKAPLTAACHVGREHAPVPRVHRLTITSYKRLAWPVCLPLLANMKSICQSLIMSCH